MRRPIAVFLIAWILPPHPPTVLGENDLREKKMRKVAMVFCSATLLLLAIPTVLAQTPSNEHQCPSPTAIPPYVSSGGTPNFSRNQNLCLPQLAPTPTGLSPLAFLVQGVEPGIRVDSQGTIYVTSIRGVPGGDDLWRWDRALGPIVDGGPNSDGTLPFRYEGQPDNCGIFPFTMGGCAGNVNNLGNPGVTLGGGDDDIAVNGPDPSNTFSGVAIPNVAFVSLSLADVTAANSKDRGKTFSIGTSAATGGLINLLNPGAANVPGDDRMWIDAFDDPSTVYMNYHDLASGAIHVELSTDGGAMYNHIVFGEAIDANTLPAAQGASGSGNVAGQIKIDKNTNGCSTRGTLYQIFSAPDSMNDNPACGPMGVPAMCHSLKTVYVGVSPNAIAGGVPNPAPMFTDYKIFTSLPGSSGATNGTGQVFPALATDNNGFAYAVWSDNNDIYLSSTVGSFQSSSATRGSKWNPPVRVNQGATVGGSNVFPWVAADANGHVVVVWLGETNIVGTPSGPVNSNDRNKMENGGSTAGVPCSDGTNKCWAQWKVYAAETVNGNDSAPLFTQYIASDHVIHAGTVSTGGLGGGANRNLADFFQVALDRQHRANITFADDHILGTLCSTQTPGHCTNPDDAQGYRPGQPYFTRQLSANPNIVGTNDPSSCFHTVSQVCSGGGRGDDAEGDGDEQGSDGHEGHFAFKTPDSCHPSGEMDFDESDTGEHMTGTRMDAVTVSGNQATITGAGTLADGTAVNYTAVVLGNMPLTGANTFAISWISATGSAFQTAGPLTGGYITVRTL
jgi:hypothetical protein